MGVACASLTGLLLAMMRAHHHHAGDHQRVALSLPLVEELRQPDRAAGAADIGDLHAFDGASGAQDLLDRARGLVPSTAGRRRDEHLEQLDGLRLSRADGHEGRESGSGRDERGAAQEIASGRHGVSFPK